MNWDQLERYLEPIVTTWVDWVWAHPMVILVAVVALGFVGALGKQIDQARANRQRDALVEAVRGRNTTPAIRRRRR